MLDLSEIKPYNNNPRNNDEAVEPVMESIKNYGFKVPMILDRNKVIVTGHTRYRAAQALGLKEVPVIFADDLSDEQVRAFRLADNKTQDYSLWDNKKLLEELEGLDDYFTGFDLEFAKEVDGHLDEKENSVIAENQYGVIYEATFRSMDEEKIAKIKEYWETLDEQK